MRLVTLARYVWAAPNTVIGLALVSLGLLSGATLQVVSGVLEASGGLLNMLLRYAVPIDGGVAAITFGHVVIARDHHSLNATRAHERVHVRQYEIWGPFFIPAYLVAGAWAAVNGRGAYDGNYFEEDARRRESSFLSI